MGRDAKKAKEQYDWYKSHGICVNCGHEEAEPGRVLCLSCKMDKRERGRKQYRKRIEMPGYKEKKSQYKKERYERLKAKGLCPACGKRAADFENGRTKCGICSAKDRKAHAKMRAPQTLPHNLRVSGEFCYRCCKPIQKGEYKLCPECYEKSCEALEKARKNIGENYFSKANAAFWGEIIARKQQNDSAT